MLTCRPQAVTVRECEGMSSRMSKNVRLPTEDYKYMFNGFNLCHHG